MASFRIDRVDRTNAVDLKNWGNLLLRADGATLFHHPDFLSYHGNRFNEHHLGIYKGNDLFGIIPLAIDEAGFAKSPYGASYGGFIFAETLSYKDSKSISELFLSYLKSISVKKVVITPPVDLYYENSCSTFIFSLLAHGFKLTNSDITSILKLGDNMPMNNFSSRTRRSIKKAKENNVTVNFSGDVNDFWKVMEKTFSKHNTNPTHSPEQWEYLCAKFPDRIFSTIAYYENKPVSAIGYFQINKKSGMSFYIANDTEYQEIQALTYLIAETLGWLYKEKKLEVFDFGTSSVNMVARENIFEFKENFGSHGSFRHTLSIDIT